MAVKWENGKLIHVEDEQTQSDWLHNYPFRIVAPKALALQYPNLYVWFQLNDLPMEKIGDNVHVYINEIMPEHQSLIDNLNGVIVIEPKP